MTPSVYVIQRSSGQLYCVTKSHYENYKHWYDFIGESMPAPNEDTVTPVEKTVTPEEDTVTPVDILPPPVVDIEMIVKNKKVQTRRRS